MVLQLGDDMDKRSKYFLGVGVGLVIAWVTGGLAYYYAGQSAFMEVIELELVVSIILIVVAYFTDTERVKRGKT